MQEQLENFGYDLGSYGADGIYGADTEKAVRAYQSDNGLDVDGVYGMVSRAVMKSAKPVKRDTVSTLCERFKQSLT